MDLAHAMWVHGNNVQIEYPDRINSLRRAGFHTQIEGELGTDNWFHFAIPTSVIVNNRRLRVGSVMVVFKTGSADATVRDVHIYDGENKIAQYNSVNLSGNIGFMRFDVPSHPEVIFGIGVSIGVNFGIDKTKPHTMQFISAGCDFIP